MAKWYGIVENPNEVALTCVNADSREEAVTKLDRNDSTVIVLSEMEMKNLMDAMPCEAGEWTTL